MNDRNRARITGDHLPVMEIFSTLQGEGYHTGKAALFIRLAGCDIGCNWCDSKASWDSAKWPLKSVESIISEVESMNLKSVIISGGEPLVSNLEKLTAELKRLGYTTFLETAGCYNLTGSWDWICLSPKKQTPPIPQILSAANELKVIVENNEDFTWAEQNAAKVSSNCLLYLQPEWSVRKTILPQIVSYIRNNPSWILSLQSHKYIGIP